MQLPSLHESVILIDTEFLIKSIRHNYSFYTKLYPGKKLTKLELPELITSIAASARLTDTEEQFSVIFFYRLVNSIVPFMNAPNDISAFMVSPHTQYYLETEDNIRKYELFSFFSDPEYNTRFNYYEEFCRLLEGVVYNKQTSNICIVSDDAYLNPVLDLMNDRLDKSDKSFVLFRSTDSRLVVDQSDSDVEELKFHFVNFDYVIGLGMGLRLFEL